MTRVIGDSKYAYAGCHYDIRPCETEDGPPPLDHPWNPAIATHFDLEEATA